MRLIDAEAFLKTEIDRCGGAPLVGTCTSDNEYLSDRLKNAPTIEAKPIVHAHWENKKYYIECSNCKEFALMDGMEEQYRSKYCPHCGAQMDEFESDTNVGSKMNSSEKPNSSVKIPVISIEDVPKLMREGD